MFRSPIALTTTLVLAVSACDGSPTVPADVLDAEAAELLASGALESAEQHGPALPSLQRLLHRTLEVIRADEQAHTDAVAALRRAHAEAARARAARQAGDTDAARAHQSRSHALTLRAIIGVLGPGIAEEAVAGVDHALASLTERLQGKTLPDRVQHALDRAHALDARAHAALAEGRPGAALGAAIAAADVIRSLSPRYQARKAIERANRAFRAAREAVGSTATESEVDALRQAHRHLNAAVDAFQAKQFRNALRHAAASADLSIGVLQARTSG